MVSDMVGGMLWVWKWLRLYVIVDEGFLQYLGGIDEVSESFLYFFILCQWVLVI